MLTLEIANIHILYLPTYCAVQHRFTTNTIAQENFEGSNFPGFEGFLLDLENFMLEFFSKK